MNDFTSRGMSFLKFWGRALWESFSVGWLVFGIVSTAMPAAITLVQHWFPKLAAIPFFKTISEYQAEIQIAIAALFLAAYLAYAPYKLYKDQLGKHRSGLSAEFENIVTGPVENEKTIIVVLLCLRNNGPETIVENYELHVTTPDHVTLPTEPIVSKELGISINGKVLSFKLSDYLPEKTLTPIIRGGLVRGWVAFQISGVKDKKMFREGINITLTFRDINEAHEIKAPPLGAKGPGLQYRPGLSLEWKDDQEAAQEPRQP